MIAFKVASFYHEISTVNIRFNEPIVTGLFGLTLFSGAALKHLADKSFNGNRMFHDLNTEPVLSGLKLNQRLVYNWTKGGSKLEQS